jgi:hypothetical protein
MQLKTTRTKEKGKGKGAKYDLKINSRSNNQQP